MENNETHYLAQYQALCFEANNEKLQATISEAVANCMTYAGIFGDGNDTVVSDNAATPEVTKPRRGRKPKSVKEDEENENTVISDHPITAEEAAQRESAIQQEIDNLQMHLPEVNKNDATEETTDTAETMTEEAMKAAEYNAETGEVPD